MSEQINSAISMKGVKKTFGDKTVLKGVDIDVKAGEIFGLLGPSGAGKTTIIKILTGQLKFEGDAAILGVPSDKLTPTDYAAIGTVLDESGLFARLNCYDNLAVIAQIYNVPKDRITQALEKVKLSDAVKKPVNKLSKGMTQRLVFARAILNSPKILFLDEPTSGLDPSTALEIHKLIFELRDNGATVFLTTHNMNEAAKLCDNVALLNEGEIIEYGAPDALCRKYNHEKRINLLLNDGEKQSLKLDGEAGVIIAEALKSGALESIHSSEPDLGTVFISLTGRRLD